MKIIRKNSSFYPVFIVSVLAILFFVLFLKPDVIYGQGFSGNDPASYQCFDNQNRPSDVTPQLRDGVMVCDFGNGIVTRAVIRPLSLQQLEIWFVRIVYIIWALVATFSFVILLGVAYQYIISRDAGKALANARDRIAKYALGFALVFLAIPILSTTFRLLGVDDSVRCYQGLTGGDNNVGIGFQFFFTDLCTDPRGIYDRAPIEIINELMNTNPDITLVQLIDEIRRINGTACDKRRFSQSRTDQIYLSSIQVLCVTNVCDGTWNIEFKIGSC